MTRLLDFKALTAGLALATLSLGLAASPAEARMGGFHGGGFHGSFGGFRGGFGGMRMGGFHPGFGGMRMGGFHPGFARVGFVNRPFAFNRPFIRPAFVHRPFAFHRPFFFRHRRFPAGAFAAGLVGGAALAYGYPYYGEYPYYTTAAYGGECYVVRRPGVDWWGNLVIRRRLVCY